MRAKILLVLGSVVLSLVALEVVLARFAPQRTLRAVLATRAPMYRQVEGVIELRPGFRGRERAFEGEYDTAIEINSLGYRQPEFDPEKGDQTRIVVIGDSFTFGHGVEGEEAWPRVLERHLVGQAEGPVEVINAGVDGRWVDEYYVELTRRGLALDPDVVVVGFFVGNDIDGEDARSHVWRTVDERGRPVAIDLLNAAVENGYRVHRPPQARWRFPGIRDSQVVQLLLGAWRGISQLWDPDVPGEELVYAPVYAPETAQAVERVQDLFAAMAEAAGTRGARFLVVMIPTRAQVERGGERGADGFDWEKPQRMFAAFFAARGIPFIDLLAVLRAAAVEAPVYFRFDAHWTARGHAVAAAAVAEHLARDGFPPARANPIVGGLGGQRLDRWRNERLAD